MAQENQNCFDLQFFMESQDVGLYNIAKEIFSYLDPMDLNNMKKIGQTNKKFDSFLKKEEEYLNRKFEMVTLVIPRSYKIDGKFTFATENCFESAKILEDTCRVSVSFLRFPRGYYVDDVVRISIIGYLEDVMETAWKVGIWVQKYSYIHM